MQEQEIKLTQYSKGAGCGCKIAPSVLQQMLKTNATAFTDPNLLVGNATADDAAVYDLQNGTVLISTADFFMPIVDDPYDFGCIAAANSISDVYAMGGTPITSIALLGWPIDKLAAEVAARVLEGARATCAQANISLAGGHTIDSAEPIFGLSVTGIAQKENIKQNNTAKEGDVLFLTKPIGVGILSTAQKRGVIQPQHTEAMLLQLKQLNSFGAVLGKHEFVTAVTDVTGFGLLGHLIEMAEGAGLSAELLYADMPVIDGAKEYLAQRIVPDATYRNWNSYSTKVGFEKGVNVMEAFSLLPDPQTNGGLLFSVNAAHVNDAVELMKENGLHEYTTPVGRFTAQQEKIIKVM